MTIAHSRITAQGQTSVPLEVRRKLGIGRDPFWNGMKRAGIVVVRRAGRYTSEEVHQAVFPDATPVRKSLADMKEGHSTIRAKAACAPLTQTFSFD